jgi:UDP-GlcNAc:undecaprenyl-phosphate GlcNAc-1-phosphate transferase
MEWVPLLAGAVVAALIVPVGLRTLAERPVPAGVLVPVAALIALGPLAALQELAGWDLLRPDTDIFGALDQEESLEPQGNVLGTLDLYVPTPPAIPASALFAVPLALGAALLGLLDDVLAGRGGLATGILTIVGVLGLALLTFADYQLPAGEYLLAAAVVALATDVFAFLGERPGASTAAFVLVGAGLLLGTQELYPLRAIGLFAGPLLVLGAFELRRKALLGHTGSTLAGALAGVWIVLSLDTTGQIVALGLLVILNPLARQFAGRW